MSTQTQLREALDRQAIRFIEQLEAGPPKDDEGKQTVSDREFLRMKRDLFVLAQDWLVKSKKLFPHEIDETEGDGVRDMKAWIANPDNLEGMVELLFQRGVVVDPTVIAPGSGRPSKGREPMYKRKKTFTAAVQKEAEDGDDSELARMLVTGKVPQ